MFQQGRESVHEWHGVTMIGPGSDKNLSHIYSRPKLIAESKERYLIFQSRMRAVTMSDYEWSCKLVNCEKWKNSEIGWFWWEIERKTGGVQMQKPSHPLIITPTSWRAIAKGQQFGGKQVRDVPGQGWGRRGQWDGDTKSAAYDFKLCPQTRWQPPARQLPAADKAQWPSPTNPPPTKPPATRQSSTQQSSTRPNPARTPPGNRQLPPSVKP